MLWAENVAHYVRSVPRMPSSAIWSAPGAEPATQRWRASCVPWCIQGHGGANVALVGERRARCSHVPIDAWPEASPRERPSVIARRLKSGTAILLKELITRVLFVRLAKR